MTYSNLGLVSVGRSDEWVYRPLVKALPGIRTFHIGACGGTPDHILGETVKSFRRNPPDVKAMFVAGDRLEMLGAAIACTSLGIPLYHIGGGAVTAGSQDDFWRNCITKLSAVHLVESRIHAQNVLALGEEYHRIYQVGPLALSNLQTFKKNPSPPVGTPVVITYHPNTMHPEKTEYEIEEILEATRYEDVVICHPNNDFGSDIVLKKIRQFGRGPVSLGGEDYWQLLSVAKCVVGNSSSGIIEAPALGCPTINVGTRQDGRPCGSTVVHVIANRDVILSAIKKAERFHPFNVDMYAVDRIVNSLPSLANLPLHKPAPRLANSLVLCY